MKRLLLCVAFIAWSGFASAAVYKWVDAQGKLQYGDTPPDGVHAELVELLGTHTARSTTSRPETAKTAPAPTTPASDVAQTRDKQCADAQARYKQLIEGRRLYKAGPDGERQYLNSEEIDAERLNAKRDIDTICNSAT
jgi:uncharacterized iron-regulated membrane protein